MALVVLRRNSADSLTIKDTRSGIVIELDADQDPRQEHHSVGIEAYPYANGERAVLTDLTNATGQAMSGKAVVLRIDHGPREEAATA